MSTFVGFGFGPIQAGLFLAEAFLSGNFDRLVVAEVLPDVVEAVHSVHAYTVNIGYADRIETLIVHPVEIYSPQDAAGRDALIAAVTEAGELATALPSVNHYTMGGNGSIQQILAAGLRRKAAAGGPLAVVYAAENHTRAAELLEEGVMAAVPPDERVAVLQRVQFLDTIIGKMSGVPAEQSGLVPLAPGLLRAFLVEAFNRILITQIQRPGATSVARPLNPAWDGYRRGIEVFVEKPNLVPFAEAKLYGHNAGHALAGYLGRLLGCTRIEELRGRPDVIVFVRDAMAQESGIPLCKRFAGVDPLFTPDEFRKFAEELIVRMLNPFVRDTVVRVCRDPARKLGWEDRFVGAMRLALAAGIEPRRYAWGAAAALETLGIAEDETAAYLVQLWMPAAAGEAEVAEVLQQIGRARHQVRAWVEKGFPVLETVEN